MGALRERMGKGNPSERTAKIALEMMKRQEHGPNHFDC
jgi:hypothetical protein